MKAQPTTKELIAMLYERLPELFDRSAPAQEPVGTQLVPVELTQAMKQAWVTALTPGDAWKAMLAAAPAAQRRWVGLTEEEILECRSVNHLYFYKAIEAKLKEKNT